MATLHDKSGVDSAPDLFRSVEFLSTLVKELGQPFSLIDAEGKLLFCSGAFEQISGYCCAELLQMGCAALIPESAERIHALSAGDTIEFASDLQTKGGEPVPVDVRLVRMATPEAETVFLLAVNNLSERQRLEADLRQSQKMEAIGRLAGGIAHDFNNVLTTILGLSESMISGRIAPSSESLKEIHQAAAHAAELTRSLLAFSRRQLLQMRTIEISAAVESAVKMVSRLIGEDIHLDVRVQSGLPPIRADQSQIEQVLLNLSLNARDAMPKGGDLHIEVGMESVDEDWCKLHQGSRPGKYVMLSVRDTGEGMDEETLRRVFEPFFTRKAPGKGTGLGLSMVYGIVKQHDAFIAVESAMGRGTTFTIYFPPGTLELERAENRQQVVSARGSATILVVEDEKSVRRLVLEVLSNLGYRTFAAANGEEAIKVFERWADQIDLVLLDAILPKKGAREVYEQIRLRKPSVRFLFTSGYNEVFINKKFELDPSFDFLRKPFTTVELATRIRNALL